MHTQHSHTVHFTAASALFSRYGLLLFLVLCLLLASCSKKERDPKETAFEKQPLLNLADSTTQELVKSGELPVTLEYICAHETTEEITITDAKRISEILEAILNIDITGETDLLATDSDDTFVFTLADGSQYSFTFNSHHYQANEKTWEVEGDAALWKLVR